MARTRARTGASHTHTHNCPCEFVCVCVFTLAIAKQLPLCFGLRFAFCVLCSVCVCVFYCASALSSLCVATWFYSYASSLHKTASCVASWAAFYSFRLISMTTEQQRAIRMMTLCCVCVILLLCVRLLLWAAREWTLAEP